MGRGGGGRWATPHHICTIRYYIILYDIMSGYILFYYSISDCIICIYIYIYIVLIYFTCYVKLYYIMLCYIILYCIVLYYFVFFPRPFLQDIVRSGGILLEATGLPLRKAMSVRRCPGYLSTSVSRYTDVGIQKRQMNEPNECMKECMDE